MTEPEPRGVTRTRIEAGAPAPAADRGRATGAWIAALLLAGLAGGVSYVSKQQLDLFLADLDGRALERAASLLERTVEQQRTDLLSEVRVLADDTRVRASIMTAEFSEATVKDVLDDLKKASGASVLAVIDVAGKVQAVTGADGLKGVDLGASPVVKEASERAAANVWTFPDRVLVIGVAPIRSGDRAAAFFMMGYELGAETLSSIERALGVAGAVVVRERMVASSSREPGVVEAVRRAADVEEDRNRVVRSDRAYVARVTRAGTSAGAGRVVWLVPMHHQGERARRLQLLGWMPIPLVGLTFAVVALLLRRKANGGVT
jgi:hypothetical protein